MPELKFAAKIFITVVLLFLSGLHSLARDMTVSIDRLSEDTRFLADTARSGRVCGSRGLTDAAFYAARQFRDAGLQVSVNSFRAGDSVGHNVQGFLMRPGASKYIIVMAHADGVGENCPGADSNASGVAALLELARTRRFGFLSCNVIYVMLDGHHEGMSGAVALWDNLVSRGIDRQKIAMVVNLDILGSNLAPPQRGWKQYLIALGASRYEQTMQACNNGLELRLYFDYYGSRAFTDLFYRKSSDHCVFLEHGVPCVMFTSGITMNTNKVSDTAETLNYDLLARRVQLISRWMESL